MTTIPPSARPNITAVLDDYAALKAEVERLNTALHSFRGMEGPRRESRGRKRRLDGGA